MNHGSAVVWRAGKAEDKLLCRSSDFIVCHPFASKWPFETWIVPNHHPSFFGDISDEDLEELAQVLSVSLFKIFVALGNPDYNYVLHSAPLKDRAQDYYVWHLQIIPRLTKAAGFELGSGMAINTALPEETGALEPVTDAQKGETKHGVPAG